MTEDRIYLGGYEIYRRMVGATVSLERETLHVSDDNKRIVLFETKTVEIDNPSGLPQIRQRWQLDNHLGSSNCELNSNAQVISYEEYHPFGSTAFHTVDSGVEVSAKRYRYTGKERDDETGLYYYGARYYASWLGRWMGCDSSLKDSYNLFVYVKNNPVISNDPTGNDTHEVDYEYLVYSHPDPLHIEYVNSKGDEETTNSGSDNNDDKVEVSQTLEFDEMVVTSDTVSDEESDVIKNDNQENNTNVVNDIAPLAVSKAAGVGLGMVDNAYDVAVKYSEKELEVAKKMHTGYREMKDMGYNIKGKGGGTGYLKKQIGKTSKKVEATAVKKLAIEGTAKFASKITFGVGIGIDIAVDQAFNGKTHSVGRSITTSTADAIAVLAFSKLFMKFGKNIPFFGWPLVIGMIIGYGIGELSGMIYDSLSGGRDDKKR